MPAEFGHDPGAAGHRQIGLRSTSARQADHQAGPVAARQRIPGHRVLRPGPARAQAVEPERHDPCDPGAPEREGSLPGQRRVARAPACAVPADADQVRICLACEVPGPDRGQPAVQLDPLDRRGARDRNGDVRDRARRVAGARRRVAGARRRAVDLHVEHDSGARGGVTATRRDASASNTPGRSSRSV